jgi:hypothetical protein
MIRPVTLDAAAAFLDIYPRLSPRQALGLVRAARSYQDALWIADSDPRLAWLRLVTATETVAQLCPKGRAEQTLSATHPEIAQRLSSTEDPELTRLVTEKLVQQSRVMARFLEFLKAYGPGPPRRRPAPRYRIRWNKLQDQLRAIYRHRSAARWHPHPVGHVRPTGGLNGRHSARARVGAPRLAGHCANAPAHIRVLGARIAASLVEVVGAVAAGDLSWPPLLRATLGFYLDHLDHPDQAWRG